MGFILICSVNDVGIYLGLYLMRWMGHIIATDRWSGAGGAGDLIMIPNQAVCFRDTVLKIKRGVL